MAYLSSIYRYICKLRLSQKSHQTKVRSIIPENNFESLNRLVQNSYDCNTLEILHNTQLRFIHQQFNCPTFVTSSLDRNELLALPAVVRRLPVLHLRSCCWTFQVHIITPRAYWDANDEEKVLIEARYLTSRKSNIQPFHFCLH